MCIGYVDTVWADTYVTEHFLSNDSLRTSWEALEEEDKEVLLRRSFEAIEKLPFTGRKHCKCQVNAFPRNDSTEVPKDIMAAQVENAIYLSDTTNNEDVAFYERLWQFGISSYSIGNLSESTGSGAWGRNTSTVGDVASPQAAKLLKAYISGSYDIKGRRT